MAEDLCLIQYVRDNFGEEYIHNYVNIGDERDDTMDTYCLDINTFTEYTTFDHSSATAGAASNTTPFTVPDLFSSPSPCTEGPATAMECIDGPYPCGTHSPDGEPGLRVSSSVPSHLQPFDRPLPKDSNEYGSMYTSGYAGLPQANNIQLEDFHLQRRHSPGQGFEGNKFALDEMLLEKSAANCTAVKTSSTSGIDNSNERRTSFWRGKTPALLMQQLKGPSLSASSSSSEARSAIKSPPNQFQTTSTFQDPRSALNLTTFSGRDYRSSTDIRGANLPMQPVSTLSKSAPSFSGQRLLPPLSDHLNVDSARVSLGRVDDRGQTRLLRSSSFDPQLIASKLGDVEMQAASTHLKQRRNIMPGLAILGEMQRNAASGNNSWSSSSTSPGPSSNIDQDKEVACQLNYSSMSVERAVVGGDRAWKKAKGELQDSTSFEGGAVQTVDDIAAAVVDKREKSQLREKFMALLQIDPSTSKEHKAKILDDTIRFLKALRKRLNVNEADSIRNNVINTQSASPATSSRGRTYGDHSLASPIHLEDLELETAGVEISPHLNVDNGPQIEVRMMENQHVMVKLTAKDRPGLFHDIMAVLRSLRLDIQHANIRTGNSTGQRHDIFAAKMQLPFLSSQSTHSIAMALNQVISATATPLASLEPHTPHVSRVFLTKLAF